ncbi:stage II sporulation protein R [Anoxybacter fermentans]|uniref:Stage II sporulation protein R n=1 Tax=Anoxybacter fermentans TaxID=1323375 RepID=A0A3S9SXQ3_9FIRM|nr:stage II sporulation protein R [Anoxybacter fermentans]AZR73028.1 stage II sporulation protein R [Anoxybacter fermentans]
MKRLYILIIVTIVILICLGFNASQAFVLTNGSTEYAYRSNNLLRLHILANSSSPEDQYLKRQVRNLILKETSGFFKDIPSLDRAVEVTSTNLPNLKRKIEDYLQSQGKNYSVKLEIGRFEFPTRTYGNMTLPEGEYQALRVVLGKGEGNNWWCVLFPPLCLDNEDDERQLMALAFTRNKRDLEVKYRFKILDTLEEIPQWVKMNYLEILRLAVMGSNAAMVRGNED